MSVAKSLYAKYIFEREEKHVLEVAHGFLTYKIGGQECFLADIYVEKEARRSGVACDLILMLNKIAREEKCEIITANIHLADPNANSTLPAALAVGFKVINANNGVLLISRKVTED